MLYIFDLCQWASLSSITHTRTKRLTLCFASEACAWRSFAIPWPASLTLRMHGDALRGTECIVKHHGPISLPESDDKIVFSQHLMSSARNIHSIVSCSCLHSSLFSYTCGFLAHNCKCTIFAATPCRFVFRHFPGIYHLLRQPHFTNTNQLFHDVLDLGFTFGTYVAR